MLDKYDMWINIKGGEVPLNGQFIHICSNDLPDKWWSAKTKYNEEALFRRITTVHWHYAFKKYRLYRSTITDDASDKECWAMTKFLRHKHELEYTPIVHPGDN